ncbi:AAA family ATPase [Streptomyces sp. NPDC127098]|uniref:AAA family ATPase n=1 Tax=Streptomyces sp. NPDC127098 TaxID=3347137 RepID=UPI003646B006
MTSPSSPRSPASPGKETSSSPSTSPSAKARPGELRAAVAKVLADDAAERFSVTELARLLGHSTGAIGNACETLTDRGEAERVGSTPRRYQATALTAAAARHAPRRSTDTRQPPSPAASPTKQLPPVTDGGPITRPNGQQYHPRALARMPDVEALRRLRQADVPVLLYGPPGTGKTSLVEAAFPDLITVAGDGDTTVGDLVGEYTQSDSGGYEFVYGPLIVAMTEGRALLIDDATLISPKVLAALYPAMDGRRQIQVKAHRGETITAGPGFYVIAGHNPGVHGAVLTEALASRFAVQIQVTSDYDLAASLGIDLTAVRVARNLAQRRENDEIGWAPQLRELLAFQKISGVLGADVAFANLVGIAPPEDREIVAKIVTNAVGNRIEPLALGRQLPPSTSPGLPRKGTPPPSCPPTSPARRR